MERIWKFPLTKSDEQTLEMPAKAKILCVQIQNGVPCIWAQCDEDAALEPRTFRIYGTGHALPANPGTYISTYQSYRGMLVFHVFEL